MKFHARSGAAARSASALVPVVLAVLALGFAGCSSAEKKPEAKVDYGQPLPPGAPALIRVTDPREIPDFRKMYTKDPAVIAALDESLEYFAKPSSQKYFPYSTNDSVVTHDMEVDTLRTLRGIFEKSQSAEEFNGWMHGAFDVYKSYGCDGKGTVLFTGYYLHRLLHADLRRQPDA
jgi:membrane-bound lytic murein transglycosylase A